MIIIIIIDCVLPDNIEYRLYLIYNFWYYLPDRLTVRCLFFDFLKQN